MKIKEIVDQNRRDFNAVYVCENCGHEQKGKGYDDKHFHENVIPKMKCEQCFQIAPETYRPLATKHDEGKVV